VLAASIELSRSLELHGASAKRQPRQEGTKRGRFTDSVAVGLVHRRHGLDLSATFASLAVHAGEVAKVKSRQAQTEVLTTEPAAISRMLLQGLDPRDPRFREAQYVKGLLADLLTDKLLQLHVSTFHPRYVPAGRAQMSVEVKLGALAFHLDALLGDQLVRRAQEVGRMLADLSSASPNSALLAVQDAPANTPFMHTPVTLQNPPLAPVGGSGQGGGAGGMAAQLKQVQVHVAVGLVTAALGAHCCAPAPPLEQEELLTAFGPLPQQASLAYRDWVRATCGGCKVLWNAVGMCVCVCVCVCVSCAVVCFRNCGMLLLRAMLLCFPFVRSAQIHT
jgi:hypothetical protein